jgi:hypothetical protein
MVRSVPFFSLGRADGPYVVIAVTHNLRRGDAQENTSRTNMPPIGPKDYPANEYEYIHVKNMFKMLIPIWNVSVWYVWLESPWLHLS